VGDRKEPSLEGVLETVLYHAPGEAPEMERTYRELLGLPMVARWSDGMAFRVGGGVVLLFDREKLRDRDEPLARHGTSGDGHLCLLASPEDYEEWKERLTAAGISIDHEEPWEGGRRSFYFRDPAGNLLEIADGDMWPS
jgi:catechol 2,3-dioxygenase-like lactoylglutathione lyase family enzyme